MTEQAVARQDDLLNFWFGPLGPDGFPRGDRSRLWFGGASEMDDAIRARFADDVELAVSGSLDAWGETARGRLALILLLDQFPRNLFRGTPRAFACDTHALRHALAGLEEGQDGQLAPIERAFFYLPLEHAEDRGLQRRSVRVYEHLVREFPAAAAQLQGFLDYAVKHRDIIERFGRFPHRNAILGRASTPEEITFLETAERFGQGEPR
ncbi:membrane protein [Sulfurifustis variabilis]|uniref:Membrane protein n=1 Tax=Sulfurifustis variabilis TaxID=1675686 RepID=A0A1B4VC47_9GAMM|nr:DUF924 family protein [Sulfurifustis variabilis]BAU48711.1 membrane protein [Sulfurifustis variabilis]